MSILVDKDTKVVVQGITGRAATRHTQLMLSYGTKIVAGVTPGKRGLLWENQIPIYDTLAQAKRDTGATCAVSFVPTGSGKEAILEAIDCEIEMIVMVTEGIPIHDMLLVHQRIQNSKTLLIGPSTPGIIVPGRVKVGFLPERACKPGNVGIISRSGTLSYELAYRMTQAGIGQSTWVGIGGDPIKGQSFRDLLKKFARDPETSAVLLVGEIGGSDEEMAADYLKQGYDQPVVAHIAGRNAPKGKQMGHAGAIIRGDQGRYETKIEKLSQAGVKIAEEIGDVVKLLEMVTMKGE